MLEVFVKYLCFVMMTLAGCIIIKKILNEKTKVLTLRNCTCIFSLLIIPALLYNSEYSSLNTIIVFCINIIIYKIIFNKSIVETIILSCEVMLLSFVADLVNTLIYLSIFDVEQMRNIWFIMLIVNISASLIMIIIASINKITKSLRKIIKIVNNNTYASYITFLILIILVLSVIDKSLYSKIILNKNIVSDILIIIIFLILLVVYIIEKNSYNKLSQEYDTMFNYIQEFEDWIEKEQFNRHEYKNQLAVLRCLTKEKKVKDKIDEILEDNIKLEGKIIHELKWLPKGGIKGLMYYKSAIAQKNKIDLTINVSIELRSLLSKLSDEDVRTICKLIGIYYDNAIEAATETRKKIILVEIYELKDRVSFVFSNTFKKHNNFDDRNKKGVSSKGEGHGNGLYFANKLLEKNDWLESKQEIIDKYYVQQLIVHKKNTK